MTSILRIQQGFPLTKLVVIMLLLSILAAVIWPKLLILSDEANLATANAVSSAFTISKDKVKSEWLAMGGSPTTIELRNKTIPVSAEGWPTISNAYNCEALWGDLIVDAPPTIPYTTGAFIPGDDWYSWTINAGSNRLCIYLFRERLPEFVGFAYYAENSDVRLVGSITKFGS